MKKSNKWNLEKLSKLSKILSSFKIYSEDKVKKKGKKEVKTESSGGTYDGLNLAGEIIGGIFEAIGS